MKSLRYLVLIFLIWSPMAAVVGAFSAEMVARLDDMVFSGVPFFSSPSSDDLRVKVDGVTRGAPGARFGKWQLNSRGFRGPEIRPEKEICQRIVVMGASETFGLYESPDHEYPAALRQLVRPPCREVINSAIVGMTLGSMADYWRSDIAGLAPDVVVLYPNPLFYLAPKKGLGIQAPEKTNPVEPAHQSLLSGFQSRFLQRLRNAIDKPPFLQAWLDRRAIGRAVDQSGAVVMRAPSKDGLLKYEAALTGLIGEIQRTGGTRVILIVPARRYSRPDTTEEMYDYTALRVFTPAVPEHVIGEFANVATDVTRAVGARERVTLVDLDHDITGCRECFGDLVHFTDKGAARVATLVSQELGRLRPGRENDAVQ
jgi:hypothetical protein